MVKLDTYGLALSISCFAVLGPAMGGCATTFDVAPVRELSVSHGSSNGTSVSTVGARSDVELVNEACVRKTNKIRTKQAQASDRIASAKNVTGIVTGVLGAIGSGTTAGVAQSNEDTATGIGIFTAVVAGAGAIVTAFIAPGSATIDELNRQLTEIDSAIKDYNDSCAGNPDATGCNAKLGKVRGHCVDE